MTDITAEERDKIAEVARDVLQKLLDLMEVSASITPSVGFLIEGVEEATSSSIVLDIEGEDPGILIGRRGQTLVSLQYVVRLIVGNQTGVRLPIIVDVEGYKRRRCEALQALAWRIAEQVRSNGEPFALEPMSAFDRRIIHLTLANDPDVATESTGVGEVRKVVILPETQPD